MTTMIAMHYPSAYAPPVGVWWWDEASATVRRHYLADFDGVVGVAEELANVKTPAESGRRGSWRCAGGCPRTRCAQPG